MLVDSHCHLDFPDFDAERDAVIARARAAGVGTMLTISTRLTTVDRVIAIAERHSDVWATVGVHPHEAGKEAGEAVEKIVEIAAHPRVVGIGETGLDYFYEHSPRAAQKAAFRAHVEAARRTQLPLIVHTRDADEDTVEILTDEMGKGSYPFLIHCFSSSGWLAEKCVALGGYISLSGIVTFKTAQAIRDAAANVPLDRLLVETDSPYLAPMPHRGKRNEPAFVRNTAARLAEVKGVTPDVLATATTNNFFRLFSKSSRPQ